MAKKSKLICTIILLMFIAIMIPVAIFASNGMGASITNIVKFNVSDIEGKFFYAVKGNAKPEIHDIGYDQGSIKPALLFSGVADEDQGKYIITNGSDVQITTGELTVPSDGILFDEEHLTVEFYFVFLNTAEPSTSTNDNRNIKIHVSGINNLDAYNVNAGWSYVIKTTTNNTLTQLDESGTWIDETIAGYSLDEGVDVPPKNGELYYYLIMKYTLALTNVKASFTTDLNLTIHLEGYVET